MFSVGIVNLIGSNKLDVNYRILYVQKGYTTTCFYSNHMPKSIVLII